MNPVDPGVFLNDVLAQADGDVLDDFAADQALVAPICQASASHFSFILDSSDAQFELHSFNCRTAALWQPVWSGEALVKIRRRWHLINGNLILGRRAKWNASREEVVFFMSCTIIE